jgi:hypothetical protein
MNETARRHAVYGAYQERSRFGADLTTGKKILLNFFLLRRRNMMVWVF